MRRKFQHISYVKMNEKDFRNLKSNCDCQVCKDCQIMNIHQFLDGKIDYISCTENMDKKPNELSTFETFHVFNLIGEMPWHIKSTLQLGFNKHSEFWESLKSAENVYCRLYFFDFVRSMMSKNARILVFWSRMTEMYYLMQISKSYNFSLKTLAGLKVLTQLTNKQDMQWLLANQYLPTQLADFLLSLQ